MVHSLLDHGHSQPLPWLFGRSDGLHFAIVHLERFLVWLLDRNVRFFTVSLLNSVKPLNHGMLPTVLLYTR